MHNLKSLRKKDKTEIHSISSLKYKSQYPLRTVGNYYALVLTRVKLSIISRNTLQVLSLKYNSAGYCYWGWRRNKEILRIPWKGVSHQSDFWPDPGTSVLKDMWLSLELSSGDWTKCSQGISLKCTIDPRNDIIRCHAHSTPTHTHVWE